MSMSAKEGVKEAVLATPPTVITASSLLGIPWQTWAYALTAAYTVVLLLRQLPKCYGCIRCFIDHKTCPRTCKD